MKTKTLSQWAMIALIIVCLSEVFSYLFAPSTTPYVLLKEVLPIGFSVVGASLLLVAYFREQKGR